MSKEGSRGAARLAFFLLGEDAYSQIFIRACEMAAATSMREHDPSPLLPR